MSQGDLTDKGLAATPPVINYGHVPFVYLTSQELISTGPTVVGTTVCYMSGTRYDDRSTYSERVDLSM